MSLAKLKLKLVEMSHHSTSINPHDKGTDMPHRLLALSSVKADFAAAVSGSAALTSWIGVANEVMQLGATAVAIVAGLYAIKWHKARIQELKKKVEEVHKVVKETPEERRHY